jgi:F0F1-type ATP synthase membrane subunit b/b'
MLEPKDVSQLGIDELDRTVDEYRAKLEELVQKEKERLRKLADTESNSIVEGAWRKAEEIIAESQRETQKTREEIEHQAKKESAKIISNAQYQAQQIISEAEARDKKEAKKRTKLEVEEIISKAKEESNKIIAQAKKAAEKEASEMLDGSREEAQQQIKDEIDKYRAAAQARLADDIAEAQKKAKSIIDDGVASCTEVCELIKQIIQKTETVVDGFKNELQTELGELTQVIALAGKKIEQLMTESIEVSDITTELPKTNEKLNQESVLLVQLDGEESTRGSGKDSLFRGQMKLKAGSSCDYKQIRKLRDFLLQIPNIRFTGEFASEEETTISLEVQVPLPLLDILSNMPSVEKVVTEGDGAKLILNTGL